MTKAPNSVAGNTALGIINSDHHARNIYLVSMVRAGVATWQSSGILSEGLDFKPGTDLAFLN